MKWQDPFNETPSSNFVIASELIEVGGSELSISIRICEREAASFHEEPPRKEGHRNEDKGREGNLCEKFGISLVDHVGICHFWLSQGFVHIVFVVRLIKPTLLKSMHALEFLLAIRNWWNCLFVSHYNYIDCFQPLLPIS